MTRERSRPGRPEPRDEHPDRRRRGGPAGRPHLPGAEGGLEPHQRAHRRGGAGTPRPVREDRPGPPRPHAAEYVGHGGAEADPQAPARPGGGHHHAYSSIEGAIEAMREGAFHYIPKPFKNEEVLLTIRNGLERRQLADENKALKKQLQKRFGFDNIIGKSKPMQQVFELVELAAPSKSNILILGESGTGKELVAKAIHHHSRRADGPFVTVNSGSMPTISWSRTSSDTSRAPSPVPSARRRASSRRQPAARSSSTRSAISRWRPRPSSCAWCRRRSSCVSAAST